MGEESRVVGFVRMSERVTEEWTDNIQIHGRGGTVVRTSDAQSREPISEYSCCLFKALAILFTSHCLSSLSWSNECLAIYRGICEQRKEQVGKGRNKLA